MSYLNKNINIKNKINLNSSNNKSYVNNLFYYVIGLITIICIVFWIYYYYYYNNSKKVDRIILISNPTNIIGEYESKINISNIILNENYLNPIDKGSGITLIWEMYISNNGSNISWYSDFTKSKPIFNLDDNIIIKYHPSKGNLMLYLKYKNINNETTFMEINLGYIKIQKWNNCCLLINENHIIFFVDGNIEKSKSLNIVPIIKGSIIKIGEKNNNFMGKIRKMDLIPYALSVNDILN